MPDPTEECRLLATRAGLHLALAQHPAEVQAALEAARKAAAALPPIAGPRAEPWPPMRVAPQP